MSATFDFLQDAGGRVGTLGEKHEEFPALAGTDTVSPLADRGAIGLTGADTVKLLQGQLTCDLNQLENTGTLKGALCDARGRMICSMVCVSPAPQTVLLVLHRELVPATLETLGKYAPFYKTTLEDASDRIAVFGVQGRVPELPRSEDTRIASLSDSLHLCVAPTEKAPWVWETLQGSHRPCGDAFWEYLLIRHGEGEVKPATSGEFIPQMLNFQFTGAVSFRKGCYTGQEIVARMQYLGKLKRRMYHLRLPAGDCPAPGTIIATAEKKDVGTVVSTASLGDVSEMLAVLTADGAAADTLICGDYSGTFEVIPLPYEDRFPETTS